MKQLNFFSLSLSSLLIICILFSMPVRAQDKIGNEFRLTLVPTFALSKKLFLTTYAGYVYSGGTKTNTVYLGAPFIAAYRPHKVVELDLGCMVIGNFSKTITDNIELRPIAGVKIMIPNTHQLNIFNWTRYEMRNFFYKDDSLNNMKHRIRNRIGIEFPITKNAWQPNSLYGLADFEFFYTFSKSFLDRYRQRIGLGYVISKNWRLEFIYHIQLVKSAEDKRPEFTDNIFRFNFKWTIPHKTDGPIENPPDLDE
jgi:hypothetical protein